MAKKGGGSSEKNYRSSVTGRFVTEKKAKDSPRTTEAQARKPKRPKPGSKG